MALHLVTAAQAEDHISSSDDARLYEAFVGSGGIVFSQGNKMSASMTDPNTMRIMDGVALLCGRYWNITNYEEVTITNGTPGMNSIALVVANIKTDPSEAVTLKVYEGVETEGEPVMPSYIEGYLNGGDTESEMPLYAVTKTGLSVGDPMPQFEVFLSERKFRDSISLIKSGEATISKGDNTITFKEPFPAGMYYNGLSNIAANASDHASVNGRSVQVIEVTRDHIKLRFLSSFASISQGSVRWIAFATKQEG